MDTSGFSSLKVRAAEAQPWIEVELDHGRANEMGSSEIADWEQLVARLEHSDVRALITYSRRRTRKGTPVFIAGANVTERADWSDASVRTHVRRQRAALQSLRRAPVFHVVVVDGRALGWGTEFLITGDYRIATDNARFGLPETSLGILPGAGGTGELWTLIGVSHALRLGMTGAIIDADEALQIGLVQARTDDVDAALDNARELASQVARRSPTAVAAFKRGLLAAVGLSPEQRTDIEARAYEACLDSGDAAIGRKRFREIIAGEDISWGPRIPFEP